ncbi:DNA mismatch repair protein MutL, partial [Blautia wexlerae]|nr:DNA mismatch repair protein MutL [Blautia wexlerae]
SLMVGKMPACVLHLEIPYQSVDVNVHPAKIEVRFINERPIFDAVYHGVKTALNQWDSPSVMKLHASAPIAPFPQTKTEAQTVLTPQKRETVSISQVEPMQPERKIPTVEAERFRPAPVQTDWTVRDSGVPSGLTHSFGADIRKAEVSGPEEGEQPPAQDKSAGADAAMETPPAALERKSEAEAAPTPIVPEKPPARLAGEAFGTYILLERGDELVVIDKHAAHERMLYEELKANGEQALPQLLLQPIPVTLEKNEYAAVLNAMDLYEKAGFELEDFGEGTVLVRSAPLILGGEDVADAVMEIAGYLQSSKNDLTTEKLDWLYHNVACRAAVKAGDESRPEELLALAERLEQNPNIRYCPHGRPVSIVLKKRDLEKQFGRI